MLRKIMIMILLILTVVWFTNSDSIQSAREFIQNNIYVWSETQEEKLPIYCVDTDKQRIALTFDTAWGNEDIKAGKCESNIFLLRRLDQQISS